MRVIIAIGLGLALTGTLPSTSLAQDGMTAAPRAGETVLTCADGGWDVAGGTCRGRGGVAGSQIVGSGIVTSEGAAFSTGIQPNPLFGSPAASPTRQRGGWTDDLPR